MIASSSPSSGSNTPPLASKQAANTIASALPKVLGDRLLELAMQRLCAADEAHRRHAETELLHGAPRRRDDVRMVGETEIIVGAEIDGIARALRRRDMDAPALRPGQQPLTLCEALRLDVIEGGANVVEKGVGHEPPVR